ncbi:hypothetical protein LZQ00_10920 [Sphingobacterium sp. SRCM116780]|uniref:hypothetical protein n=1 Tax=Sphingobacterium sp. SRCM116780 TaxID=2907623 RepID=UPI001F1F1892|nr:hypothetical protein [Sphingobacterium sp. SRCM116780]UIR54788.1 hypothetical protein LZQ00_10920 [Sphingobacterium sp. SRCM116780]
MIKNLLLAITLSLFVVILFGQTQYATTTNGQKVILKSDGTWEYAKSNVTSINRVSSAPGNSGLKATSLKNKNSSSRSYIRGPRGGCYYINGNGGKTYVDRSMCN